MSSFLKSISSDNESPLYVFMIIQLCPLYTLIHFRKIDMTRKNSGEIHQIPPIVKGEWCHKISGLTWIGSATVSFIIVYAYHHGVQIHCYWFYLDARAFNFFKKWIKWTGTELRGTSLSNKISFYRVFLKNANLR